MIWVIIVAGGRGLRMNRSTRKQYLLLADRPILAHTLLAFDRCVHIDGIVLVIPQTDFDFCRRHILLPQKLQKAVHLVAGGGERQESVWKGLSALASGKEVGNDSIVLIHDAVRPFVNAELIEACIQGAERFGACVPVIPAVDTLKRICPDGFIDETLSRNEIRFAQTPQAFNFDLIRRAHRKAVQDGFSGTDDASLVEYLGEQVAVVNGSRFNMKITTPEDLLFAEAICRADLPCV